MKSITPIVSLIAALAASDTFAVQKSQPQILSEAINELHQKVKKIERDKNDEIRTACDECDNLEKSQSKWVKEYMREWRLQEKIEAALRGKEMPYRVSKLAYTDLPPANPQDCKKYVIPTIDRIYEYRSSPFAFAMVLRFHLYHTLFPKEEEKAEFPFHLNSCQ